MNKDMDLKRGNRKEFIGTVISDKMHKTCVVRVSRLTSHTRYGKIVKSKQNFKVHDEKNEAKVGDRVRIIETRPLSRDKRFRLAEILSKSKIVAGADDL